MHRSVRILVIAAAAAAAACASPAEEATTSLPSFEAFRAGVPHERSLGRYLVEGDVLVDENELREYYLGQIQRMAAATSRVESRGVERTSQPLILKNAGGVDSKWDGNQKLNLTYCVSHATFGLRYIGFVTALNGAVAAWENAANVDFRHLGTHDDNCTASNNAVLFNVDRFQFSNPRAAASAFFPGDPRSIRQLLVSDAGLDSGFLQAILTHELGHILGFLHETGRQTTSLTADCGWETPHWRPLTNFDANSIMQCSRGPDLAMTSADRNAVGCLYGQPPGRLPNTSCGSNGGLLYEGIEYRSHVQNLGWLPRVRNDDISGTVGLGLRVEAMNIRLVHVVPDLGVCYSAHVAGMGWQPEVCNDGLAGTTGQSRAVEAVRIRLVNAAPDCSVTYQAHVAGIGWLNPVSNNAVAGTTGESRQLEALKVRVSPACLGLFPF
jgi:hypothetical protein